MTTHFVQPLWFLMLIPGIALALVAFFVMVKKKFWKSRNRITSLVIHIIIVSLAVSLLTGMTFVRTEDNSKSNVIILVDRSGSIAAQEQTQIDTFIGQIIQESGNQHDIGIITFGRDVQVAAPIGTLHRNLIPSLHASTRPLPGATNIAAALNFAARHLEDNHRLLEESRIIILSDGIETDGNAMGAIASLAARQVRVDTAFFPAQTSANETGIIGIDISPDPGSIRQGDRVTLTVRVQSNKAVPNAVINAQMDRGSATGGAAVITPPQTVELFGGGAISTVPFVFTINDVGLFRFSVWVNEWPDSNTRNNRFYTHIFIDSEFRVLMLEGVSGASNQIGQFASENGFASVTMPIASAPTDINELLQFEQIMLLNTSIEQFPSGFEQALDEFVRVHGGGLLTSGGGQALQLANWQEDSTFARMMPVEPLTDSPPIGVVVAIDSTTSMGRSDANPTGAFTDGMAGFAPWQYKYFPRFIFDSNNNLIDNPTWLPGNHWQGDVRWSAPPTATWNPGTGMGVPTKIDAAVEAAYHLSGALSISPNSFMGVLHYNSSARIGVLTEGMMQVTPGERLSALQNRIRQPFQINSTVNDDAALTRAADLLVPLQGLAARHVIMISDADGSRTMTQDVFFAQRRRGIQVTYILIDGTITTAQAGALLAIPPRSGEEPDTPHLQARPHIDVPAAQMSLIGQFVSDILAPQIFASPDRGAPVPFVPNIAAPVHPTVAPILGEQLETLTANLPTLARAEATVVLEGPLIGGVVRDPIYAEWQVGNGTVGTFTFDFGSHATQLFNDWEVEPTLVTAGVPGPSRQFLSNVVQNLMPAAPFRAQNIEITLDNQNLYTTVVVNLNPGPDDEVGERLVATVTVPGVENALQNGFLPGQEPEVVELDLTRVSENTYQTSFSKNILRGNEYIERPGIYIVRVDWFLGARSLSHRYAHVAFSFSAEDVMFWSPLDGSTFLTNLANASSGGTPLSTTVVGGIFGEENETIRTVTDPRLGFLIACVALFLLDIVVRKFKWKWPWEIHKERKAKRLAAEGG